MPTSTGITMQLGATDQTSAAIGSARNRFRAFGESLRETGRRTSADARRHATTSLTAWEKFGARLIGLRYGLQSAVAMVSQASEPIRRVLSDMHELSDRAAEVGASSAGLQRLTMALGELGVKHADLESVTKMMNYMRKSTGEVGVEGFRRQAAYLASITDESKRAAEATRIFGREGVRLGGLLRAGPEAFLRAIDDMMAAMPGMSNEAIRAASDVDKGFTWIARDISGAWQGMVAEIVEAMTGGLGDNVEMGLALLWEDFKGWFERIRNYAAATCLFLWDVVRNLFVGIPKGLWETLKLMGSMATEFGRQFWDMITGGTFDTSALAKTLRDGLERIGSQISFGDWFENAADENAAVIRATERAKAKIREAFSSADELGSSREALEDIEDVGTSAARSVSDAWRGTGAVMANTAQAMKVELLSGTRAATSAARRAATGSHADAARTTSDGNGQRDRTLLSLLENLTTLLTVQRDGWESARIALAGLEMV